jgi:hypothetical protein
LHCCAEYSHVGREEALNETLRLGKGPTGGPRRSEVSMGVTSSSGVMERAVAVRPAGVFFGIKRRRVTRIPSSRELCLRGPGRADLPGASEEATT